MRFLFLLAGLSCFQIGYAQIDVIFENGHTLSVDSYEIRNDSVFFETTAQGKLHRKGYDLNRIASIKKQYSPIRYFLSGTEVPMNQYGTPTISHLRIKKKFIGFNYYNFDQQIDKSSFHSLLSHDENSHHRFGKALGTYTLSGLLGNIAGFINGYQIGNYLWNKPSYNKKVFRYSLGAGLLSVIFQAIAHKKMKSVLTDFNHTQQNSLGFKGTENGYGLVLEF